MKNKIKLKSPEKKLTVKGFTDAIKKSSLYGKKFDSDLSPEVKK